MVIGAPVAERVSSFQLSGGDRFQAGADDLDRDRALVEDESGGRGHDPGHVDADCGQSEIGEEDVDERRRVAKELGKRCGGRSRGARFRRAQGCAADAHEQRPGQARRGYFRRDQRAVGEGRRSLANDGKVQARRREHGCYGMKRSAAP